MNKKLALTVLAIVLLVTMACDTLTHLVGGYTPDEYNAQATKIAEQSAKIDEQAANIAQDAETAKKLDVQLSELQAQVDQLNSDMAKLASDRDKYKDLVCTGHNWNEMMNDFQVWVISTETNNTALAKIEKETNVFFYLTQWVALGKPALDAANKCVILDPAKWDVAK